MDAKFYESIENELLTDILPYWEKHACDKRPDYTGFFGYIDNDNNKNTACERSIVMTARFLWTYSAAARFTKKQEYLKMADFAYQIILNKYSDKKYGGVFWSVLPDGTPKITKKQIYGEAFCCYGLSEYAAAVKELKEGEVTPSLYEEAMNYALDIYNLLEIHARDKNNGGYIEACAKNWKATKDMILSEKDMNCPKSMNTNLHVLEAYTNLYRTLPVVYPDAGPLQAEVGESLKELAEVIVKYILQPNRHLGMFFDINWNLLSNEISYGHDIEGSWLLWEAACELQDEELKSEIKESVISLAETALNEGYDKADGCMENLIKNGVRDRCRVWWVQAEAINGFYNAWEITKEQKYADACVCIWNWILNYQIDKDKGEWWWEVDQEGKPVLSEQKGGNWKTSYHNGRFCMEILQRKKKDSKK